MAKSNAAARDEIIASIRRNLAVSAPFDAVRQEDHGHREEVQFVNAVVSPSTVLDNFRVSAEMLAVHFSLAENNEAATKIVEETIERLGAKRVAISSSDIVATITESIASTQFIEKASAEVLFDCDLGITSAQWAIAETGTLVLESEKENSRLTSLVPTVHLCIVKASRIRQTLGEILSLTRPELSRTMTFITGASRTSDIELTLAIGVHGPKELHVVVINDQ
ncbi:MAG: lactate utilization protein [Pyrinomonadaceae bacterium]